jgi:cytochrome c-type biogenesis protein
MNENLSVPPKKEINLFYIAIGLLLLLLGSYFLISFGIFDAPEWLKTFFIITMAGLLDSVNPCAFSILFLTIAFLFSLGRDRKYILKIGLIYILAIALTYILIGVGVLKALSFFAIPNGLAKFGAVAIIIFGVLALLGELFKNFPIKLKIPNFAHKSIAKNIEKATTASAFGLGILVGLFEFPCTGGPYLLVLGMLHDNAQFWSGLTYLLWYNFVFVFPLLIVLFFSVNKKVAEKIDMLRRHETKKARISLAVLMIVLGLVVFLI